MPTKPDPTSRADAITAATAAYLKNGTTGPFDIDGRMIDVGEATQAHPASARALADPETAPGFRRTMVRTALVLATAAKRE